MSITMNADALYASAVREEKNIKKAYFDDPVHSNLLGVNFSNIFQTDAAKAEAKAAGVELSGATGFLQVLLSPLSLATNILGKVFSFINPALSSLGDIDTGNADNPLFTPSKKTDNDKKPDNDKKSDKTSDDEGTKKAGNGKKSEKPDNADEPSGVNAKAGTYRYGSGINTDGYEKYSNGVRTMLEERNEATDDLKALTDELQKAKGERAALGRAAEDNKSKQEAKIKGFQDAITKYNGQLEAITRDIAAQEKLLNNSALKASEKNEIESTITRLKAQKDIILQSRKEASDNLQKAQTAAQNCTAGSDETAKKASALDGRIEVLTAQIERAKARKAQTDGDLTDSVKDAKKSINKGNIVEKRKTASSIAKKLDTYEKEVEVEVPPVGYETPATEPTKSGTAATGGRKPDTEQAHFDKETDRWIDKEGEPISRDAVITRKGKNNQDEHLNVRLEEGYIQPHEDDKKRPYTIVKVDGQERRLYRTADGRLAEKTTNGDGKEYFKYAGTHDEPLKFEEPKKIGKKTKKQKVLVINGIKRIEQPNGSLKVEDLTPINSYRRN